MTVEADIEPPGRQPRDLDPGRRRAARRQAGSTRVATNDFLARGGDGYTMFADAARLLPDPDAPLLANEVMVHPQARHGEDRRRGPDRVEVAALRT